MERGLFQSSKVFQVYLDACMLALHEIPRMDAVAILAQFILHSQRSINFSLLNANQRVEPLYTSFTSSTSEL